LIPKYQFAFVLFASTASLGSCFIGIKR